MGGPKRIRTESGSRALDDALRKIPGKAGIPSESFGGNVASSYK
jgi:hypothetical protein